jgi:hypothetical protein
MSGTVSPFEPPQEIHVMQIMKKLALVAVVSFVVSGLAGCEKKETLGDKVDHAVDNTKKAADDLKK